MVCVFCFSIPRSFKKLSIHSRLDTSDVFVSGTSTSWIIGATERGIAGDTMLPGNGVGNGKGTGGGGTEMGPENGTGKAIGGIWLGACEKLFCKSGCP